MKRLFKYLSLGLILVGALFVYMIESQAASATIAVSPSVKQVVAGKTFNFTVKISSSSPLGSWNFDVATSGCSIVSGNAHQVDYVTSASQYSKSYSYSCKATSSGTATINVRNSLVYGFDENQMNTSNGSTSVKVITQAELEATYSDNNYLKNLSVEGQEISPAFNKDTLEYSVTLNPDIEEIVVNATKEDGSATITGGGNIAVSEGDNKIQIVVTSQKGNKRTYTLTATVKDSNPLEATINGKTYNVVKKAATLPVPDYFEATTVMIEDQEIPGFYNKEAKLTLVGLKDEEGNIVLAVYNEKDNNYTIYNEIKANYIVFYPLETDKTPGKDYLKVEVEINDLKIKAYKLNKNSKFALVYGMNIENGRKAWYVYDELEGTLQRFNDEHNDTKNNLDTYTWLTYVLGAGLGVSVMIIISQMIINGKRKKLIKMMGKSKDINKSKKKE